jgi:hypothetical protein
MNNLYHKVAVASVCTALGFALGANKEAKAATITLTPTIQFGVNTRIDRLNFRHSELSSQYNRVSSGLLTDTTRLANLILAAFFLLLIQLLVVLSFRIRFSVSEGLVLLV